MILKIKHYFQRVKNGRLKEMKQEMRWIYGYARQHLPSIILYTLLGLTGTVVGLFTSLVSKDLVDIITGHQTGKLLETFCLIIGTQLGSVTISQLSIYISAKINLKVDNSIKADIYEQIMLTDWEELSKYHSGDLLVRWSGDASRISSGLLNLAPNMIIYTFRFVSALWMVIRYDASFAVFALLSVPLSLYASQSSLRRMRKSSLNSMSAGAKMSSFAQESFSNVQTIKAFDMIDLYSKRLRNIQSEYRDVSLKYQKVSNVNSVILTLVSLIVTYSTYGWGIYKVWNGDITYGTMTMFIALSTTLSSTIQSLIGLVPNTISLTNAAKRLMSVVNLPKEDYGEKDEVNRFYEKHKDRGIGICIKKAAYTYANGTEVFENLDLNAGPRETVAIIGPSGEGKTTILRLILSIIHSKEGEGFIFAGNDVGIGGIDSEKLSKYSEAVELSQGENAECMTLTASTRQLFAYVPQGNTMFSGTIAENMRNVKEDATDEEIIDALKMACAWDFVSRLPKGIDSEIKEHGGGFSEGQAQRLSIARALIRKSPILLLDEATSALDVETEKQVLTNIMHDEYPRTSIVTTHRPSVLEVCNRVYEIRDKNFSLKRD